MHDGPPTIETQIVASCLEREIVALFRQHAQAPVSPTLRRKLRQLCRAETARVERNARTAVGSADA